MNALEVQVVKYRMTKKICFCIILRKGGIYTRHSYCLVLSLFTKNIQMINKALSGLHVLSMKYTYLHANTTLGGWGAGGYDVIIE